MILVLSLQPVLVFPMIPRRWCISSLRFWFFLLLFFLPMPTLASCFGAITWQPLGLFFSVWSQTTIHAFHSFAQLTILSFNNLSVEAVYCTYGINKLANWPCQ